VAELEAAIASVTRALGRASDLAIEMLVRERAVMRAELHALNHGEPVPHESPLRRAQARI
jgi:hypothetical protein